jgi:nucleoside-diphosphate-sugar epimerase
VTYFLTGGTGFVGGGVARRLLAAGHAVRALVRSPASAGALAALGAELHQGDVTDKASMRAAMSGADGVFHVAGWYKIGVRDAGAAEAINVAGTRHVLELVQELGVPKSVYTSTVTINSDTGGRVVDETYRYEGRHLSVYDRTKAEAHRIAEGFAARGVPVVIVQPGGVYGPGDTGPLRGLFVQFLRRTLPLIPRRTAFAWGHIDDVAAGHVLAMEKGEAGRSYFLTGPVHTMEEAIDMAAAITGIRAPRLRLPPAAIRAASLLMAPIEKLLPVPPQYTAEGLRVLAGVTYIGSNARARRELGWRARPLRDGLMDLLRHEMRLLGMVPRF